METSTQRKREKARKYAQDLERDLVVYPDDRDEILLEMAGQWADAGETDRALQIYEKVVATARDEDDAQYAIVEKIHVLDELDRQDEARAEIARLEKRRPLPGPASLMAEFFEAQGELEKALTWYNMACRDFFSEEGEDREPESDFFELELAGRARVRQALGLPLDEFDRRAIGRNTEMTQATKRIARRGRPSHGPSTGAGSFFVRSDVKRAFAEGLVQVDGPEDDDVTSYFRRVERGWHSTVREGGVTNLVILPTTVDDLLRYGEERGRDPRDQQTRIDYLQDRLDEGASTLHWPPERNQPCWCDSGRKYKKCCGSPTNR
ncbi:SEC-C metal-binding domain-containing protein [Actinoallomurus sp. NPDC050550]|uniref:SEC-C metal-binding domain-containing protein n=1 Tax=Actinoallomurus sp. NPDC050550 TaxID=3154937 RepID=UPI0033E967FE